MFRWASVVGRQSNKVLLPRSMPFVQAKRHTSFDGTRKMSGDREVVGYGVNNNPIYIDCSDFPFPAIRYREATAEICALREKEQGDWHELSKAEKKKLYRYSYCQTFAEFMQFTPEWKLCVGYGFWSIALGVLLSLWYLSCLYNEYPESYNPENKSAQLRRIIHLEMNPITGLASKWDYSKNRWK